MHNMLGSLYIYRYAVIGSIYISRATYLDIMFAYMDVIINALEA